MNLKKMKKHLVIIFSCLVLLSCDNTLKKIEAESALFKEEQKNNWSLKNKDLQKDTAFINLLLKDTVLQNYFFKTKSEKDYFLSSNSLDKFTGPMDVAYAHKYAIEYQTYYKPEQRNFPTEGLKNVPITKSLWIDKKVIYSFVESFLKDANLDGIRIYSAKYNIDASDRDVLLNRNNNGRNAVFFVATSKDGTKHKDTYSSTAGSPVTTGLYIYDYNSLCPDVCEGGDFNH